jgi:pimeloyl-ACP methyl ester carboxylesterase
MALSPFAVCPMTLALALSLSCGPAASPVTTTPGEPQPTDIDAGFVPTVTWSPCTFQGTTGSTSAECATAELPLDWERPAGRRIEVSVKRHISPTATAVVWFLHGGPAPRLGNEGFVPRLLATGVDVNVYMLDYRGTGLSTELQCLKARKPDSPGGVNVMESEQKECLAELKQQWGDELRFFSTEGHARDIMALAPLARVAGLPMYMVAHSYGTAVLQRLMHRKLAVSGAVLVGAYDLDDGFTERIDTLGNATAVAFLEACSQNPECRAKLGDNPGAKAVALFRNLANGQCFGTRGPEAVRQLRLLVAHLVSRRSLRELVAPLVFRLDRCSPADLQAIERLAKQLAPEGWDRIEGATQGTELQKNVFLSEGMLAPFPSLAEIEASAKDWTIDLGMTRSYLKLSEVWPRYGVDSALLTSPDADVPLLLVSGQWDMQTPVAGVSKFALRLTKPGQRQILVPGGTHFFESFPSPNEQSCELQLVAGFIRSPLAVDDSCLVRIPAVADNAKTALATTYFGTADLWENSK